MDINQAFPSDFLKAGDLQGPVIATISHVQMEKVGDDTKPCVYFQGQERGVILNKTNAQTISSMYGPETGNWTGQQVEVYPTETDYQGKRVACIRIRRPGVNVGSPSYGQGQQTPQPAPTGFDPNVPPNDGWPGPQGS